VPPGEKIFKKKLIYRQGPEDKGNADLLLEA
jgi:hypothetical protein